MSDYTDLVNQAVTALFARKTVTVTHPPGWQREGFPLPVKRMKPDIFGAVTQEYRPVAIFEYVSDKLDAQDLAKRMREFHSSEKAEAVDLFGGAVPDEVNLFG